MQPILFQPLTFEMYENRVKGIHYQNGHLASISSNGDVTIWTVDIDQQKISELCTTNIGCRPICLTIINLDDFADEYVLKRENSDDEMAAEEVVSKTKTTHVKNVGKVVIENDDDEIEAKSNKSTQKKKVNISTLNQHLICILKLYSFFFHFSQKHQKHQNRKQKNPRWLWPNLLQADPNAKAL